MPSEIISVITRRRAMLAVTMLATFTVLVPVLAAPLHDATERGDVDHVKQLLDQGADVNVRDDYNLTPLHFSVGAGHIKIVELLIARGADINAQHEMGTPATSGRAVWASGDRGIAHCCRR